MTINIEDKLYNNIINYFKYNNITDIEKEINIWISRQFNIERYGSAPFEKFKEMKPEIIQEVVEEKMEVEKPKRTYKRKPKIEEGETLTTEQKEEIIDKPKRKIRIIKN